MTKSKRARRVLPFFVSFALCVGLLQISPGRAGAAPTTGAAASAGDPSSGPEPPTAESVSTAPAPPPYQAWDGAAGVPAIVGDPRVREVVVANAELAEDVEVREAAAAALAAGDAQSLLTFFRTGLAAARKAAATRKDAEAARDLAACQALVGTGGPLFNTEVARVVAGSPVDRRGFLLYGQDVYRDLDSQAAQSVQARADLLRERVKMLADSPGAAVSAGAQAALLAGDEAIETFLSSGYAVAAEADAQARELALREQEERDRDAEALSELAQKAARASAARATLLRAHGDAVRALEEVANAMVSAANEARRAEQILASNPTAVELYAGVKDEVIRQGNIARDWSARSATAAVQAEAAAKTLIETGHEYGSQWAQMAVGMRAAAEAAVKAAETAQHAVEATEAAARAVTAQQKAEAHEQQAAKWRAHAEEHARAAAVIAEAARVEAVAAREAADRTRQNRIDAQAARNRAWAAAERTRASRLIAEAERAKAAAARDVAKREHDNAAAARRRADNLTATAKNHKTEARRQGDIAAGARARAQEQDGLAAGAEARARTEEANSAAARQSAFDAEQAHRVEDARAANFEAQAAAARGTTAEGDARNAANQARNEANAAGGAATRARNAANGATGAAVGARQAATEATRAAARANAAWRQAQAAAAAANAAANAAERDAAIAHHEAGLANKLAAEATANEARAAEAAGNAAALAGQAATEAAQALWAADRVRSEADAAVGEAVSAATQAGLAVQAATAARASSAAIIEPANTAIVVVAPFTGADLDADFTALVAAQARTVGAAQAEAAGKRAELAVKAAEAAAAAAGRAAAHVKPAYDAAAAAAASASAAAQSAALAQQAAAEAAEDGALARTAAAEANQADAQARADAIAARNAANAAANDAALAGRSAAAADQEAQAARASASQAEGYADDARAIATTAEGDAKLAREAAASAQTHADNATIAADNARVNAIEAQKSLAAAEDWKRNEDLKNQAQIPRDVTGGGMGGARQSPSVLPDCAQCAGDPIDTYSGAFFDTFIDLSVPGRGVPLEVRRSYHSANADRPSPFGNGWSFGYEMSLTLDTPTAGEATLNEGNGSRIVFVPDGSGGFRAEDGQTLATLVRDGSVFRFTRHRTQIYEFDGSGRLTALKDLNGLATRVAYAPNQWTVTDPAGRSVVIRFDAAHPDRITSITDPVGQVTSYRYDGSWRLLTGIVRRDGTTTGYGYDGAGRLSSVTDRRGNVLRNQYDAQGRVDWQEDRTGARISFAYGQSDPACPAADGRTTKVTKPSAVDPAGDVTLDSYVAGRLVCETNGAGTDEAATTRYEYHPVTSARTRTIDPEGHATSATYDGWGNLLTATDGLGRTSAWTYNQFNQVTTARDGAHDPVTNPTVTSYTYGDPTTSPATPPWVLTKVETPLLDPATHQTTALRRTRFRYDSRYLSGSSGPQYLDLIEITDPLDRRTTYESDPRTGDRLSATDALGNRSTFAVDALGRATSGVSPNGNAPGARPEEHRAAVLLDTAGRPMVTADEAAQAVTDAFTRPDGSALGAAEAGTPWAVTPGSTWAVAAGTAQLTAGKESLAVQEGAADGTVAFSLSAAQDGAGVFFRGDGTTANHWSVSASPAAQSWTLSRTVDGQTMPIASAPAGSCCRPGDVIAVDLRGPAITLSVNGAPVATVDDPTPARGTKVGLRALGTGTGRVGAFAFGRAGGGISLAGYDPNGNKAWVRDANGNVTRFEHDAEDRQTTLVRADDRPGAPSRESTGFHANGLVATQTDAAGRATRYGYDHLGRARTVTDPLGATTTNAYDRASKLVTVTDADGRVTAQSYDAAGQLLSITHQDGVTPNVTGIVYDGAGRQVKMTDGTGTTCDTYDSLGRLTAHRTGAAADCTGGTTVTYAPDLAGQVRRIGYPGQGEVTRDYDAAGRLTSVKDFLGTDANTTWFGYDANANLVCQTQTATACQPGGDQNPALRMDIRLDSVNRPVSMTAVHGRQVAWESAWGRDAQGQVLSEGNERYGYNMLDRLATVNGTAAYEHDKADNLTRLANGSRLTYDAANQPTAMTTATGEQQRFTYRFDGDARSAPSHVGNRIQTDITGGASTRYTYDTANRLTAVGTPRDPAAQATYAYDGGGLRAAKVTGGQRTAFTWDVNSELPLLLQSTRAGVTDSYIYGPGGLPIERIRSGGSTRSAQFLWHDQLGSTRLVTDKAGATIGTYTYDPYGATIDHRDATTNGTGSVDLQHAGQYRDAETGFTYLRARYYDPATGQFLTRDPLAAQTRSPYGYVYGNPLNHVDPSGLHVFGVCVSGAIGWGLTVAGGICLLRDSAGNQSFTYSVGGGGGLEAGGGVGGFYSNAPGISDVMGWSACAGGGVSFVSGEACVFSSSGNSYVSVQASLAAGQKFGGHVTAMYTGELPDWAVGDFEEELKRLEEGAKAWINCLRSAAEGKPPAPRPR